MLPRVPQNDGLFATKELNLSTNTRVRRQQQNSSEEGQSVKQLLSSYVRLPEDQTINNRKSIKRKKHDHWTDD